MISDGVILTTEFKAKPREFTYTQGGYTFHVFESPNNRKYFIQIKREDGSTVPILHPEFCLGTEDPEEALNLAAKAAVWFIKGVEEGVRKRADEGSPNTVYKCKICGSPIKRNTKTDELYCPEGHDLSAGAFSHG